MSLEGGYAIELAGERVQLLPQRAMFWPREALLVVADLHLAKADVFRACGIPIPRGATAQTLAELDALLARVPTAQLLILGDFLHGRASRNARAVNEIAAWRARHAGRAITLVEGNHDRRANTAGAGLGLTIAQEPLCIGPFAFCHALRPHVPQFQFAGHVHPYALVRGAFHRARVPCFVIDERARTCVLPAFGAFTGGVTVPRTGNAKHYACVGSKVVAL